MTYDPSRKVRDFQVFGEFGGVNPSIEDSCTFTFLDPEDMVKTFSGESEHFLYSRHHNPTCKYYGNAVASMEDCEKGIVTSSGMAAISTTALHICSQGEEIVSARNIYGGTYALFKNILPRFGIKVHFVDITDINAVKERCNKNTRIIYTETISNPLLEVADIKALSEVAKANSNCRLVVDNTFCPMVVSPKRLGADIVLYSLTKYVNGASDGIGGCICSTEKFINELADVNNGSCMLLGPVMDGQRAASMFKNLHTLHIRMKKHGDNAMFLATQFEEMGFKVYYPGLKSHKQHELLRSLMNPQFGFSGMLTFDTKDVEKGKQLMVRMQKDNVGLLAVSLGFYKTLFNMPGKGTSSEIPAAEREAMGLTDSLLRLSVGLDNNIQATFERIKKAMEDLKMI
jgi:methionine-gamma-lyase